MTPFFIEGNGNDYIGVFILVIIIMLLPAIIMALIGISIRDKKPKAAKVLFIIAIGYLIISLGFCGSMTLF